MNKTHLFFPLVLQSTSTGEQQGTGGGRDIFLDKDVIRRSLWDSSQESYCRTLPLKHEVHS